MLKGTTFLRWCLAFTLATAAGDASAQAPPKRLRSSEASVLSQTPSPLLEQTRAVRILRTSALSPENRSLRRFTVRPLATPTLPGAR